MQNYKEIDRIRKDPVAVRSLAKRLLDIPNHDWTAWELDFLEAMSRHAGPDPLSTRQGEKLMELRDDAEDHSQYRGLSVKILIEKCNLGRDDLDDPADAEFVAKLYASGATSIKRHQLWRLLRCGRQLGHVEKYMFAA
jgi:hypothetical protein